MEITINLNIHNKRSIFVFLLFLFAIIQNKIFGQEHKNKNVTSFSDSLSEKSWSDETYYSIEMLRLQRWIKENTHVFSDPILLKEVARLKKEAENFAENNDFTMAVFWLDIIWGLLQPEDKIYLDNDGSESGLTDDMINNMDNTPSKKFNWTKELSTGVDLWNLKFQMASFPGDTTTLEDIGNEGSGNPYSGLRLSFSYNTNSQKYIQAYTSLKYSRDYLSGEAELRIVNPIANDVIGIFENRIEGNSFYRDNDLKYVQNLSSIELNMRRIGPLRLDVKDEFLLRRYADESSTYPNYLNNSLSGYAKLDIGLGSMISTGFRNIQRIHSQFDINDYQENRIDASWFQSVGKNVRFSFENELRFRNYTNVPFDTTFQDYWENYFRGDIHFPFTSSFGTEIQGSFTKRDYKFTSIKSFPDYTIWEIEPEFYVNLDLEWRISLGFHYSEQSHQKFNPSIAAVPDVVQVNDANQSILFEDYYTVGPTLSIEFFNIKGMMFSLRESFKLQRYPNIQTQNIPSFNLYSDRNINSILLFFTWNISSRWRFTALANMDDDRSRKDDSSDSQNTILGLELNYLF